MAELPEFDWDEDNISHLARHGIAPEEVEEVFANGEQVSEAQQEHGEIRWVCFGHTNKGRFLTVVVTERGGRLRLVTAYPMSRQQRKLYES